MFWVLSAAVLIAAAGFLALQWAIARNGPAVLDTVDRLTAGIVEVKRLETVRFGEHPAQKLVVQFSESQASKRALPVLVFLHGGSWKDGDPEDYGFVGRSFAPHGFVSVLAGYRLGEDGRFPGMLEDGAAALHWVRENIARHGGDPDHIVIMGHSAGAYNAAMLALDRRWLEAKSIPHSAVRGIVGLAGPYDFYPFDSDSTRAAFGEHDEPSATQPINFTGNHAPPFLLIHGESDTTVKVRNSRKLAAELEQSGIAVELLTFPDMDHKAPLLQLASPWRGNTLVHERIRQFAANPQTSVPVQPK